MKPYIVYAKKDECNRIVAVNSSAFLTDADGWVEIDSGIGDKYHHAQNNYLDKPLYDERGILRYRMEDGQPVERTQEEMDADYIPPIPQPDPWEHIAALEEQIATLKSLLGISE